MSVSVFLSASTFLRSAAGILPKASLVGAKTVMPSAELSESTNPACLTAVTSVDSSGLPDAAVATGTWAMAWKLPLFDGSAGTAAHPLPKFSMAGAALDIIGAGLVVVGAAAGSPASLPESSLPQAASEIEKIAAAVSAVILVARIDLFLMVGDFAPFIRNEMSGGWVGSPVICRRAAARSPILSGCDGQ